MFPMYNEWPCGAEEREADPRELLPDVDPPPTAPELAQAAIPVSIVRNWVEHRWGA